MPLLLATPTNNSNCYVYRLTINVFNTMTFIYTTVHCTIIAVPDVDTNKLSIILL